MARYAMIEDASQIVVNVVEWDGNPETWAPPEGYTMVADPTGEDDVKSSPGYKYEDGVFVPPPGGQPGTAV